MNRVILAAQLLGALVFCIAATTLADPHSGFTDPQTARKKMMGSPKIGEATAIQKGREGWIEIIAAQEPGKIDFPNLKVSPEPQSLSLNLKLTAGIADLIDLSGNRSSNARREALLTVGNRRFRLTQNRIIEISFPNLQSSPNGLAGDRLVAVKLSSVVVNHEEGIVGRSAPSARRFQGLFKGEIVGLEPNFRAQLSNVVVKHMVGRFGGVAGKMRARLEPGTPLAKRAAEQGAKAFKTPCSARLTLLDSEGKPLGVLSFRIVRAVSLSMGEPMSFDFDLSQVVFKPEVRRNLEPQ